MRHFALLAVPLILNAVEDRPIPTKAILEPAQAIYRSQLLGDIDHPVEATLTLLGVKFPTRRGAKGELEIDVANDGKFRSFSKSQLVQFSIELSAADNTKSKAIKLGIFLERHADDTWTYRNASQLGVVLGGEKLVLVDVDGDGAFNSAGVDGMTWAGNTWLFPLPATTERFCTPTLDLTGLSLGATGGAFAIAGKPLATTVAEALPILQDTNRERIKIGLTPRPEDIKLSADLQKHCAYMRLQDKLAHPEDSGKPGYTREGHEAGMRSILSQGTPPERIAAMMVQTYFHREDVIRPGTLAFGVGYDGRFGGIDGRTAMDTKSTYRWPILCPVPDQRDIPLRLQKEAPDAVPGDDNAGFAITAYFGSGIATLVSHSLIAVDTPKVPIDCYTYDIKTGASPDFSGFQHCVCVIAKDSLLPSTTYEVALVADHDGKRWAKTWRFTTTEDNKRKKPTAR